MDELFCSYFLENSMSILIDKNTQVLVQGITGKEGAKATKAMLDYYTNVVCGVTPNKGGQEVEGKPVFNSIKEAKEKYIKIIGPSSLGLIAPDVGRIGVVGGPLVKEIFSPGPIGIISRSGGMTNELSWQIRQAGLGQSTAIHVGGDLLMGTTYADILRLFEKDDQTKGVVIFGEHGGSFEFEIVDLIKNKGYTKPLAIYIGGKFANVFPQGMNIGHAGAIVGRGQSAAEKESALSAVGVKIAERYEDLANLAKLF